MAIHINAHAEDRKQRSQFTHHEEMNVRADELAHAITPSMPMYASFRRPVTGETTLWHQPTEYENIGRGAMYEVTSNAYKHITLTSQRHASTRRQLLKDGEMLATHFECPRAGHAPIGYQAESRSSFARGSRLTPGSSYGQAGSRVRLDVAVVTSSSGRTVAKWASCSGTCSRARSPRKPTFDADGFRRCGAISRPTSRTLRLRGLLYDSGHTRTTDVLLQLNRTKSNVGARPRCGGGAEPGDSMTWFHAHTTPAPWTRTTTRGMRSECKGQHR